MANQLSTTQANNVSASSKLTSLVSDYPLLTSLIIINTVAVALVFYLAIKSLITAIKIGKRVKNPPSNTVENMQPEIKLETDKRELEFDLELVSERSQSEMYKHTQERQEYEKEVANFKLKSKVELNPPVSPSFYHLLVEIKKGKFCVVIKEDYERDLVTNLIVLICKVDGVENVVEVEREDILFLQIQANTKATNNSYKESIDKYYETFVRWLEILEERAFNCPDNSYFEKNLKFAFDKLTNTNHIVKHIERSNSLWLYSYENSDKELFLKQLQDELPDDYLFAYLNLNSEILESEEGFWRYFTTSICNQNNSKLPVLNYDPQENIYFTLDDWLDEVFEQQPNKKILACIDSFNNIDAAIEQEKINKESLLSELHSLIQSNLAISFIFFSPDLKLIAKYSRPLTNVVPFILSKEAQKL